MLAPDEERIDGRCSPQRVERSGELQVSKPQTRKPVPGVGVAGVESDRCFELLARPAPVVRVQAVAEEETEDRVRIAKIRSQRDRVLGVADVLGS